MPVTIRLSKLLCDRMGEEVADELVDWFNAVDATYRGDLRELNELNFARFDAKLEQRVAALDAKIDQRAAGLDAKIEALEAKVGHGMAALEARINERIALLEARLERRLGEQSRWLFAAWASLLIPIIGLWARH